MGGNNAEEGRWLARLSPSLRSDILRFQKKKLYEGVRSAPDELLVFPGLWPALQIGCLRRIFILRCPKVSLMSHWSTLVTEEKQELEHYLHVIYAAWSHFLLNDRVLFPLLDYGTVSLLQMRTPSRYAYDHAFAAGSMEAGELFPRISDTTARSRILHALHNCQGRIPSIHTFLEDTKWLEPCALIVRELVDPTLKSSLWQTLYQKFEHRTNGLVERADSSYGYFKGTEQNVFKIAYLQLFMYAWRHFPELTSLLPRKDKGAAKPNPRGYNSVVASQLATLAFDMGFRSEHIKKVRNENPEICMIKRFLEEIRPSEHFEVNPDQATSLVRDIHTAIVSLPRKNKIISLPSFAAQDSFTVVNRCGRPHEKTHTIVRRRFYARQIYGPDEERSLQFSIHQDIFKTFFGFDLPIINAEDHPTSPSLNCAETSVPTHPSSGDSQGTGTLEDEATGLPDVTAQAPEAENPSELPQHNENSSRSSAFMQPDSGPVPSTNTFRDPEVDPGFRSPYIHFFDMEKDRLHIWKRRQVKLYAKQPPEAFPASAYLFGRNTPQGLRFGEYDMILTQALREDPAIYVCRRGTTHQTTEFARAAKDRLRQAYMRTNTNHMAGVKHPRENTNRAAGVKHIKS